MRCVRQLVASLASVLLLAGCKQGTGQSQSEDASAATVARAAQVEAPKEPKIPSYEGHWWTATPGPCPTAATLKGAAPPAGREIWCEDQDGQRHGPWTRWWNPAVVRAVRGTQDQQQRQRVEVVNEKGDSFEAYLVVSDTKSGPYLKREEGMWVHGKKDGRHLQWGFTGQVDFDAVYVEGVEQGKESGP